MKSDVQKMFDEIAPTYDALNHFLSFGLDVWWRRKAVSRVRDKSGGKFLDIAAGTGDFSKAALHALPRHIVALDFAFDTLLRAREKLRKRTIVHGRHTTFDLAAADAAVLPLRNNSFDAILVGFGIRNFPDRFAALKEMFRVMKPGGRLCVLELSRPTVPLFSTIFRWYFHTIVPLLGKLLSGHGVAYSYLPESVDAFPAPQEIMRRMMNAGFQDVMAVPMTFGVVTLFTGRKQPS